MKKSLSIIIAFTLVLNIVLMVFPAGVGAEDSQNEVIGSGVWGTVDWSVFKDGDGYTLYFKPHSGDSGTFGGPHAGTGVIDTWGVTKPADRDNSEIPWFKEVYKGTRISDYVTKIDSEGEIILAENSGGLFYHCINLTNTIL